MYNYFKGGEQYRYADRPIIVTIPEGSPHYGEHCTDYHYISKTKIELSKRFYELFGIHIDWTTFRPQYKGEDHGLYPSSVRFWLPNEDITQTPYNTLGFSRPFRRYLAKTKKIELMREDTMFYDIFINGDL